MSDSVYKENGFNNREEYLENLCEEYDSDKVYALAEILGQSEDFDGLITILEDYSMDSTMDSMDY